MHSPQSLKLYQFVLLQIMLVVLIPSTYLGAFSKKGNSFKATVIVSSQIRPYVAALNGFKHAFKKEFELLDLGKNPEFVRYTLKKEKFDLYVAIGPRATKLLWTINPEGIKLTLMVLDPESLLFGNRACGIKLRIPIEEQLSIIKMRISPKKGVGLLYTPDENGQLVSQAIEVAGGLALPVNAYPVESAPEIKKTLPELYRNCDVLLFIPDPTVISEPMVRFIIKDAIFHGVASVGYNRFFYDSGAVMAFIVDYEKVGAEAAQMAVRAIETGKCRMLAPPYEVIWNEKAWNFLQKVKGGTGGPK